MTNEEHAQLKERLEHAEELRREIRHCNGALARSDMTNPLPLFEVMSGGVNFEDFIAISVPRTEEYKELFDFAVEFTRKRLARLETELAAL